MMNSEDDLLKKKNIEIIPAEDLMPIKNINNEVKNVDEESKINKLNNESNNQIVNNDVKNFSSENHNNIDSLQNNIVEHNENGINNNNSNNNGNINNINNNNNNNNKIINTTGFNNGNSVNNNSYGNTNYYNKNIPPQSSMPNMQSNNGNNSMMQGNPLMSERDNSKTNLLIVAVAIIIIGAGAYFILFSGKKQELYCRRAAQYIDYEMRIGIKNEKVTDAKYTVTFDFTDVSDDIKEKAKKEDACANFNDNQNELYEFTNCNEKIDGDKIILTLDMKINNKVNNNVSLSEGKERFEKDGFSCSIR